MAGVWGKLGYPAVRAQRRAPARIVLEKDWGKRNVHVSEWSQVAHFLMGPLGILISKVDAV